MKKHLFDVCLSLLCLGAQAQTTAEDAPWLRAARGAYIEAQRLGIPFDIQIVENPDPMAGPVAMANAGGRCTLLLQHRGNQRHDLAIAKPAHYETAVAHEFGHCLMHVAGVPQSERGADAFALTWMAGRYPGQAQEAAAWVAKMRERADGFAYKAARGAKPVQYRADLLALTREISAASD